MPTSNKTALHDVFIGIDLGTTGVKACVLSTQGDPVVHAQVYSFPLLSSNPGWAEQDPELIFEAMLSGRCNQHRQRTSQPACCRWQRATVEQCHHVG
jgi:sugar (pentulose or hexulose) kinase